MSNKEIEIQVRVSDSTKLEMFLADKATFLYESYQKDEYFTPQHRDFVAIKPVEEWLRLRESNSNSVTYKKWHYDESSKSNYCDEYESKIEDVNQMRKVFAALDIKPVITVEKTRRAWKYEDYEIALDAVTGLGNFVEIEYKGKDSKQSVGAITDDMVELLKHIDCGTIERNFVGYPFMLLYPGETKFEVV